MTKTETNLDLTELLEYLDPGEKGVRNDNLTDLRFALVESAEPELGGKLKKAARALLEKFGETVKETDCHTSDTVTGSQ